MELERLAVDLRPRTTWEALDLGAAMTREWWGPILRVWFVLFLPWAAVLALALEARPWIALLLLWWSKPVFDRFVLHVASRAVFGEVPSARRTLGAWREIVTPGLVRQLAWARLAPARSFTLPVWQLERQSGAAARARSRVLGRRASGTALWLTVVCAHFEMALMVSLGVLVTLFTPPSADGAAHGLIDTLIGDGQTGVTLVDVAFYAIVVTIVEPLYVVCGLALYLNRRTQLEGWDIELAFRRMETRLAARAGIAGTPGGATSARMRSIVAWLGAATVALAIATAHEAHARTETDSPSPATGAARAPRAAGIDGAQPPATRDPQAVAKGVLAAPEFQEYRTERGWKRKGEERELPQVGRPPSWLRTAIEFFSEIARVAAWIAAAVAVGALLWYLRRFLRPEDWQREAATAALPRTLFGLDVRPESLPDDPAAAALALARAGRVRDALSLLYRGALVALVHRHAVPLRESATEGDALAAGRRALPPDGARYFGALVDAWQATAWGGRPPAATVAVELAGAWNAHFAAPAQSTPDAERTA